MTQYLELNLLALFAAREPIPYFPPLDRLQWEKKPWPYSGVSKYLNLFEDPSETPPATRAETKEERITRKQKEREERHTEELKSVLESWDPSSDTRIQGDPFKTVFVGRINYDTSESKLRREMESYGPVKRITIVHNQGKPRGYAFVEYEKERDMHSAYKYGDGKKIDGRRIVVDVERGRTVKSWKPRRLGGGLGGTRIGAPQQNIKYSGRVDERRDGGGDDRDRDRGLPRSRGGDSDRHRRRSRSRDVGRDRDRDGDRDRDREKRKRSRSKDRDRGKGRKDRSRSRDRERSKKRGRDMDRDKDHKDWDKDRDKDRDRKSSRRRDREKDKSRHHDQKRLHDEEAPENSNDMGDREEGEIRPEKRVKLELGENARASEQQGVVETNCKED